MLPIIADEMQFSCQQYSVYDAAQIPGFEWSIDDFNQGFVRTSSSVSFRTLLDFGTAQVRVFAGSFNPEEAYDLVTAVPFLVIKENVAIEGPEEVFTVDRKVKLDAGNYWLVSAQSVEDEYTVLIDIFFERVLSTGEPKL